MLEKIIYKIIHCIIAFISGLFLLMNLSGFVHYNLEDGSKVWQQHPLWFYFMAGPILFLLFFLTCSCQYLGKNKLSEKAVFLTFSAIMVTAGVYLILHSSEQLWSDPYMINKYMPAFREGDFTGFSDGKYFSYNPNLAGFAMYEMLLTRISDRVRFLYFINLITVELILWVQWKISSILVPQNENVRIKIIVLSFLFLPLVLHLFFVYGTLPGYFFAQVSIYFYIKWLSCLSQKASIVNLICSALALAASCILKQNFFILMIAFAIHGAWFLLSCRKLRFMGQLLFLLIIPIGASSLFMNEFKTKSGVEIGSGEPIILYIAMGLQESETNPLDNGWYNGYNFETYQSFDYDEERSSQEGKEYLVERMHELKKPSVFLKFFVPKLASTWADPTFESVYLGPSEFAVGESENLIVGSVYGGDRLYHLLEKMMSIYLLFLYLMIFCQAIHGICCTPDLIDKKNLIFNIYLIGGVLFHFISETKSSYVYYYLFSMILSLPYLFSIGSRSKVKLAPENIDEGTI